VLSVLSKLSHVVLSFDLLASATNVTKKLLYYQYVSRTVVLGAITAKAMAKLPNKTLNQQGQVVREKSAISAADMSLLVQKRNIFVQIKFKTTKRKVVDQTVS